MTTTHSSIQDLLARAGSRRIPFSPEERRRLRCDAGVQVQEAAVAIDVSVRTFQRMEAGEVEPRADHAERYRQLLDALRTVTTSREPLDAA